MDDKNKDCIYFYNKYIEKLHCELEGCSENYKMGETIFSTFNHLSVYFPDAYQHMLKVWGVQNV
jgi:hypothetical protein